MVYPHIDYIYRYGVERAHYELEVKCLLNEFWIHHLIRRLDALCDGALPNDRIVFTQGSGEYYCGAGGDSTDDSWLLKMTLARHYVESYVRFAVSDRQRIVYPDIIELIQAFCGDDRLHKITPGYAGYSYSRSNSWTTLMKTTNKWMRKVDDTIYMGIVVGKTPLKRGQLEGQMHNDRFLPVFSMRKVKERRRGETRMEWKGWTNAFAAKEMAAKQRREAFNVRHGYGISK